MNKQKKRTFDLAGMRVLVTRPKPLGEALCQHLTAAGAVATYFPAIEIALPVDTTILKRQIAKLDAQDWLIFNSPQAVFASAEEIESSWPAFPPNLKIAAIGAGSAKALHQAGFPDVLYPEEDWHSEGLLHLPEFRDVVGKRIAIVRGDGGRQWLAETLKARGAIVSQIIVYQRMLPQVDVTTYLDLLQRKEIDAVVTTSGEGLDNLKILLDKAWTYLQEVSLIVISQRTYELAQDLGFKKIFLAKNAGHSAIMKTLSSIDI